MNSHIISLVLFMITAHKTEKYFSQVPTRF